MMLLRFLLLVLCAAVLAALWQDHHQGSPLPLLIATAVVAARPALVFISYLRERKKD